MKNKTILCLLSLLMLLNISAAPTTPLTSLTYQALSNIQIERALDGTSTITFDCEQEYGYKFITPDGWYPMVSPPTSEEIKEFISIVHENNLPINEEKITSNMSTDNGITKLMVFDLNSEHYQNNNFAFIAIGNFAIPKSTPNWILEAVLYSLGFSDVISKVNYKKIDNQRVGILEFAVPTKEGTTMYGKMFLFIRNGKLVELAGVTNNEELLSSMNDVMNSIFDSLDFDIKQ